MLRFVLLGFALAAQAAEKGFVSLFDGKTLDGWELLGGKGPGYIVRDGLLVCPADGGGNLLSVREYSNFVLRFDFKFEPGGNNGLAIRAPKSGKSLAYAGMELQILDHDHPKYHTRKVPIKPSQYHGSVYDVIPAKTGALNKAGEWNSQEVTANGRKIRVILNGKEILNTDLDSVTDPAVLAKHPGLARTKGHIGWLGHGSLVEFRNVRIRELR